VDPLGGSDGDPGALTINAKKHRRRTLWKVVPEIRERPPLTIKMSTVAPWEAVLEIREHPPSTLKTSMTDPWEAVPEIWERPPSTLKTPTAGPLGDADGDPGASTINVEKHRRRTPYEVLTEI
jgi:hypothetical protein